MKDEIKLNIAGIIISCKSNSSIIFFIKDKFGYFVYNGNEKSIVELEINVIKKLPKLKNKKKLFESINYHHNINVWNCYADDKDYIIDMFPGMRSRMFFLNQKFNTAKAYLECPNYFFKKNVSFIKEAISHFIFFILVNFLSDNDAMLIHAAGIRSQKEGFLFVGSSGCGKSTMAKLWKDYKKGDVFNDEKVIIKEQLRKYFIYASPWQGDFFYTAKNFNLNKIFFIYPNRENVIERLTPNEAFKFILPNINFTFWSKSVVSKISLICLNLVKEIPCYRFGFKDDKSAVKFVDNLK